ncbi:MAG: NADH-quinone oxidoreductase subunit N [Candidatus Micrarchaeales archaeon]|nr:NADH-quinone oxidoreductase subunit N [Candidatus Micrarchaeales archaeon]
MYDLSMVLVYGIILLLASGMASVLIRKKAAQLASSSILLALIAVFSMFLLLTGQNATIAGMIAEYPFSLLFVFLFSITLLLVNLLSYKYSSDYISFSLLFSFAAAGAFLVALSASLVTIILGIELMSLPTAFMIMINGKKFIEAAVKLFILAALSIAIFAFALALVFPYDPSLALTALTPNAGIAGGTIVLLALLLFIAALSFDASLFPFNLWVPDVYEGAPANITAMLAGVNKKVAFVALFEVLFIVLLPLSAVFSLVFQVLAVVTMFFGNIVALVQTNVKRLFAYSAISQAGYIAIGFSAASLYGIEASIYQIFAHAFMIIGTFAIILWLESKNIKTIDDYAGLGSRNRIAAFSLTIFMLSMIGIPPLMGFVGKFLLFTSAIDKGLLLLAVIAIFNSFLSIYYYAKVILSMYSKREKSVIELDWAVLSVAVFCLIAIIALGIYPQPLINLSQLAGASLSSLPV